MLEALVTWTVRALAAWAVAGTALPLVRRDAWWIRACEFPRVQLLAGAALALAALPFSEPAGGVRTALLVGCGLSALLQVGRILPFTPLWPRQDSVLVPLVGDGPVVSLLVANVLMSNREADRFLALAGELEPDLLLVIETDRWWQQALEPLHDAYPHRIEQPQEDTYGMLLLSRLPLEDGQVRFLVEDDVPSIRCTVVAPDERRLLFHGLHPKPPAPQESTDTTERDAELLLVARELSGGSGPVIVAGDLNDVAWSYTTRLFRRISGLLDPRVGRRLMATFPASRWWLRFPLDHIFHSTDLGLVELRRAAPFGSDHLPVFGRFRFCPIAEGEQEPPRPDGDDLELAREKIERGLGEGSRDEA